MLLLALAAFVIAASFGFRAPMASATFGSIEITDSTGAAATTFSAGSGMYATVTDPNRNTNPGTAEQITATISATSAADLETFTSGTILKETGNSTGIFRNTTALPTAAKSGSVAQNDGTLEIDTSDTLTATYTDATNETATFDYSDAPLPHIFRAAGHIDDGDGADAAGAASCSDPAVYAGVEGTADFNLATNGAYISTDRAKWDVTAVAGTASNIASNNDIYEVTKKITATGSPACHGWNIHEFEVKISPFTGQTTTSLTMDWKGIVSRAPDGGEPQSSNDAFMVLLNRSTNAWEIKDTEANDDASEPPAPTALDEVALTATVNTGLSSYIDTSGFVRFLVVEYGVAAGSPGGGLYTDYVSLTAVGPDTDTDIIALAGGSIFGTVWNDKDRDGIFDTSEPGIANVSITLLDGDTGATIVTDKTDANGDYGFIGFPADKYSVRETDPTGFISTTPNTRGPITLAAGQVLTEQNFGDVQQLSTTGLQQRYVLGSFLLVLAIGFIGWASMPRLRERRSRVPIKNILK